MDASAFEQVYGAFQDFHAYFAPLFGRREARDHSRHYLQALLVQSGVENDPMDGGRRYSIQSPLVSNLSSARSNLPPPLTLFTWEPMNTKTDDGYGL